MVRSGGSAASFIPSAFSIPLYKGGWLIRDVHEEDLRQSLNPLHPALRGSPSSPSRARYTLVAAAAGPRAIF